MRGGEDAVSSPFADAAAKMPTTVRSLLVDNAAPCSISIDALLADLGINPERHLLTADDAKVVHAPSSLSAAACAALREAVDRSCGAKADSVDGLPDHQLPLTFDQLSSLIGGEEARALAALPAAHFANKCADAEERPSDIFVRRYAGGTRPWNPFHHDSAAVTVNVALCSDDSFVGGKLVAVCKGEVSTLSREEGEATIHDSRLLHAVTRITSGVRYSLICFIGQSADADAEGGAAGEREAFQAFLGGLTEEQRERVLEELERAVRSARRLYLSCSERKSVCATSSLVYLERAVELAPLVRQDRERRARRLVTGHLPHHLHGLRRVLLRHDQLDRR